MHSETKTAHTKTGDNKSKKERLSSTCPQEDWEGLADSRHGKTGTPVPLGDLEGEAPVPCGLGKLPRNRLLLGLGFTGELRGERAGDAETSPEQLPITTTATATTPPGRLPPLWAAG